MRRGELSSVIANDYFRDPLFCKQYSGDSSDGAGCEVIEFADEWEFGVIIRNDQVPDFVVVEQICSQGVPWMGWYLHADRWFTLLGPLVFLACLASCYYVLNIFVDPWPVDAGLCTQLVFFYALVPLVYLLQYVLSQCVGNQDSTLNQNYAIFLLPRHL